MISSFVKHEGPKKRITLSTKDAYGTSVLRILGAVIRNPEDITKIQSGHTENNVHLLTIEFNSKKKA